jgi:putative hydrolase of the HAD superfamily
VIAALTFDATHTLFHCPRLGEIYAEILSRHGLTLAPEEVLRLIALTWQELSCSADPRRDRFAAHPEGEAGWWRHFVARIHEHAGAPPPTRFVAAELYHRFSRPESYAVYDDVVPALTGLRAQGLRLAVVSNWDRRLAGILAGLRLDRLFDAVLISAEVGVEKPHPEIFHAALRRLAVEPAAALHVGDQRLEDVEGAVGAGMRALHLLRTGAGGDLKDLGALPDLLVAERAGRAGKSWAGAVLGS